MKIHRTPLALAATLAAGGVQAQTVLKIGHVLAKGSHYDVGTTVFCDEIDKGMFIIWAIRLMEATSGSTQDCTSRAMPPPHLTTAKP